MNPNSGMKNNDKCPAYRKLMTVGGFEARVEAAYARLSSCDLCPRRCGADRRSGQVGLCKGGLLPRVSSFGPHFGEEAPLVGRNGSGTVFLTGCNLQCLFCQNHDISHCLEGREVSPEEMASMMHNLAGLGCHNLNFVTPTHFVPQIMHAILLAAGEGLSVPVVYNCGGYESLETLRLLEGAMDIYMPDFKFWSEASSRRYLDAPDYPERARAAICEMHRQVGDLVIRNGVARHGLLVRHLVMPGGLAESEAIFKFLAEEVSPDTFVNVMDQYRPCYRADEFPEIARRLRSEEMAEALRLAARAGLKRVYS
jgi:putative pyruvate formate lyase activating enzyme